MNITTQNSKQPEPQSGPFVTILINNAPYQIHQGRQTVVAIKTVGGIPLADELSEVTDHKLVPLADDALVTIKGHEQFISNPRTGRSS